LTERSEIEKRKIEKHENCFTLPIHEAMSAYKKGFNYRAQKEKLLRTKSD